MTDELWPGGPRFIRDPAAFRLGTDAVLLADFASQGTGRNSRGIRACDLGCGTGVIAILLAWDNPVLTADGVELQPRWADIARENARLNGFEDRVRVIDGDLRACRGFMQAGAYDLVVANPPYYPSGSGKSAENDETARAREEQTCTLDDVCAAAAYLTRWGGRFALVHKPERLSDVIFALKTHSLEPKRLRLVQHKAGSAPNLILIESRRGGNPSLTIEPPLILADENGRDTDEVKRIYHRDRSH
jgi:tRNA1Val (adenine37-N6)-methyltransferase